MSRGRAALCALLVAGCSPALPPAESAVSVQWIDRNGATWFAPPVTPAVDDPVHTLHPEPGVVAVDRRTGRKTVIRDPSAFLRERWREGPDQTLILIRAANEAGPPVH